MIDLDSCPPCRCGATLTWTEYPEEGEPSLWASVCAACGRDYQDYPAIPSWRSGGVDAGVAVLVEEHARIQRENLALRALAQKSACAYGHRSPEGVCRLGYPGCACADDIIVWDAERSRSLGAEMEVLRSRLTSAEAARDAWEEAAENLRMERIALVDALVSVRLLATGEVPAPAEPFTGEPDEAGALNAVVALLRRVEELERHVASLAKARAEGALAERETIAEWLLSEGPGSPSDLWGDAMGGSEYTTTAAGIARNAHNGVTVDDACARALWYRLTPAVATRLEVLGFRWGEGNPISWMAAWIEARRGDANTEANR